MGALVRIDTLLQHFQGWLEESFVDPRQVNDHVNDELFQDHDEVLAIAGKIL